MKGISQYLRVELGLEKSPKKCKFITYATHCQHDYKVTGGLEWATKVCVCCFCMFSVSLEWTGLPFMIYGFCSGKMWQRPCSAIPACHGNIPLHHKLPLHSVKVFFVPSQDVLFGNLLHKGYWGPVTVFWQSVQHFSHSIGCHRRWVHASPVGNCDHLY